MITGRHAPPSDVARRYVEQGWWDGSTLTSLLEQQLAAHPEARLVVHSEQRPWSGTIAEVHADARRLVGGLRARGVRMGDPVVFQLPNGIDGVALFYALGLAGAVLVPLATAYGSRELGWVAEGSGAELVITETGGDGRLTVDDLRGTPDDRVARPDPADVAVIGWTSGTTARPKGAMLTHRALAFEVLHHMAPAHAARANPLLSASPVSHVTGMLVSLLAPLVSGQDVHLLDAWHPDRVLPIMRDQRVSAGTGAPVFLQSLLDVDGADREIHDLIGYAQLGGAPVSPQLVRRAAALGITVTRGYGCTEHPSVALGTGEQSLDVRATTDGAPAVGVEVRVVDDAGRDVAAGTPGELWTRGPDLFAGYTDPQLDAGVLTPGGWYRTGDVAVLDADGNVTIVDRLKDIIIRSGMNVSAADVEAALTEIPGIRAAAVVGRPDARTQERVIAFVESDGAVEVDRVRTALEAQGMARFKWPVEVHRVESLPRTPSGKVRKSDLRP